MIDPKPKASKRPQRSDPAVSRWNNEGGAGPGGRARRGSAATGEAARVPPLTNAELVQLRIRVIALERIVMALLAHPAEGQLDVIREMAAYISPRTGRTRHRLTIGAAEQMISLLAGAAHFRTRPGTRA